MRMDNVLNKTVKELVTDDYRAASVFEKYSIDFCCGGKKSFGAACEEKGLDPAKVAGELTRLTGGPAASEVPWDRRPLDLLTRHIKDTHHQYVQRIVPTLLTHTRKILSVHGQNHPGLAVVAERFHAVAQELSSHMAKEERVLFPYIDCLARASRGETGFAAPPFGTIRNPIRMMETEHESAGNALYAIREITGGYTPPPDACTTYRVTLRELEEFELDLHQHVHLENNILFPRAIELEETFLQ